MKKETIRSKALFAVTLLTMLGMMTVAPATAATTWSSDIRLTYDPSSPKLLDIAVDSNGNTHIAWEDRRDGNYEIYYTKLDNDGNTLVDDTRLTDAAGDSRYLSIAMDSSDNVHIAWCDKRDGNYEIYYTKLDNDGNTLVDDTRLTDAAGDSKGIEIATDSSDNIHTSWRDMRDENWEVYYTKLDNDGNTLVDDTRLTDDTASALEPSIAVDSCDNIHIVWPDSRDGNQEVYYTELDDDGNTLVDDTRLTDDPAGSYDPIIVVDSDNNIHIAWNDERDGKDVYYKKGTAGTCGDVNGDGSVNVLDATKVTNRAGDSGYPLDDESQL